MKSKQQFTIGELSAKQLVDLSDKLTVCAMNSDYEQIKSLDQDLRSKAAELASAIDLMSKSESDVCLDAIAYSVQSIKKVANTVHEQKKDLSKKYERDKHLRLVYSSRGK